MLGIAVPLYGETPYIDECLRSLSEISSDIQLLVVFQDGGGLGSRESLQQIVESDDRFLWQVEPDNGQSDAINRAWRKLQQSGCDVLTWVNADDVLYPDRFSSAVKEFMSRNVQHTMYGDYNVIDEHDRVIRWVRTPARVTKRSLLFSRNQVPGIATLVPASAIQMYGDLDVTLNWTMDLDLWLRISDGDPLERLPYTTAGWRMHEGSKTVSDADGAAREAHELRCRHYPTLQRLPLALRRAVWLLYRLRFRAERVVAMPGGR